MPTRPTVLCRADDLHVVETPRLWVVTSRATDYLRWYRLSIDDPLISGDWRPEEIETIRREVTLDPIADPIDSEQPLLPVKPNELFFAGIDRRTRHLVANISATTDKRGATNVGGAVHRDYRGQGYGHEMLSMVCHLLHRHFGYERLEAGCEITNQASRRWLTGAGFTETTAGDPTHTMPNGRIIQTYRFVYIDHDYELRCRRPRPAPPRRRFGFLRRD
ncbi:GNAT family N-acetyltransferase [Actinoplanes sp. L3-i22]|uniref:GNAT family N-acetyltransferase n=1 Tax=Actinoplanes sp. L3-i22 TaxID=2836373 RepID=UPI001C765BC8|nr:GNAT family N-acetyltransferase [Actinoplanes sp. L3-i22]BCY10409.1 hypothetical protein L3i22_054970 [Actinoplanes sp. L3-i22]